MTEKYVLLFAILLLPSLCKADIIYSNNDLISGYKADISGGIDINTLAKANEFQGYMMGVAASLASENEICLPNKKVIGYYITHNSYDDLTKLQPNNDDSFVNVKNILIKKFPCNRK